MTTDIEEFFSQETYPGSKRLRRPAPEPVESLDMPWQEDKFTMKNIPGVGEVKVYSIGAFATALGVSVRTIREWTIRGAIPDAPYRLPSNMLVKGERKPGRRLYPAPFIEACVKVMAVRGLLGQRRIDWNNHYEVTQEIVREWKSIKSQYSNNNEYRRMA